MSTTGTLEIPPELWALWQELVRPTSPRTFGGVAKNGHLLNPTQKRAVSQRSLLPEIRDLWNTLTPEIQDDWKVAAQQNSQRGWNLFVQDTAYRLKYGLPGLATPSTLHQYKVGRLEINAPASAARLAQYHPQKYWKMQKIRGTKAQYIDVPIYENFALPLTIGLSYRTNMTGLTEHAKIRVYGEIISHYQGRNITSLVEFSCPLESDWARQTATAVGVLGVARSYTVWIDCVDVVGTFEWDNLVAIHSGTNYARDFRCNDVNNTLTRINYQIEKSWEETFLPAGASFDSAYPI